MDERTVRRYREFLQRQQDDYTEYLRREAASNYATASDAVDATNAGFLFPPPAPTTTTTRIDDVEEEGITTTTQNNNNNNNNNSSTSNDGRCVVCMENSVSHVVIPCGHLSLCEDCSSPRIVSRMRSLCPNCRTPIERTMRVYRTEPAATAATNDDDEVSTLVEQLIRILRQEEEEEEEGSHRPRQGRRHKRNVIFSLISSWANDDVMNE